MENEDVISIDFLFPEQVEKAEVQGNNNINYNTTKDLFQIESFSNNLIYFNYIEDPKEEEEKKENENESTFSLTKFKELNLNRIKEDMFYYCCPVDILSKIDSNNREYLYNESDFQFFTNIEMKVYLQRQAQTIQWINENKDSSKFRKNEKIQIIYLNLI